MSKYSEFKDNLELFFRKNGISLSCETNIKDSSYNDKENNYLYNGQINLSAISMDMVAKEGYKLLMHSDGRPLNSVDAFLISKDGDWFFIEFKDCKISTKKDNIEKKGMANLLMLLDIMMKCKYNLGNEYDNPLDFARKKIIYIVVCSGSKDPNSYEQVRIRDNLNEKYTPPCLEKFKNYFFKDAYVYTEEYFERRFVNSFEYE